MLPSVPHLFITAVVALPVLCRGDSVTQAPASILVNEKDNAQLFCNYATTSNTPYLFWYYQRLSGSMEFLLYRSQYSGNTERFPGDRFSTELDHINRTIKLNILKTELTDSVVYYCALVASGGYSKTVFGAGTRLIVKPQRTPSDPSVYILPPHNSNINNIACLATDYFPQNVSMTIIAGNNRREQDKSKGLLSTSDLSYSLLGFLDESKDPHNVNCSAGNTHKSFPTTDQLKYSCIEVQDKLGDPQYNLLSLTIFGLRILFVKSIIFNVLMTIRIWVS
ncbi:T cell receptor alpha chain MC.7.G5 [Stegostoma tigrinum]|uniref:T cell receptor alpha chain MC.7.G5 n=1 Tax=Stegostoma tigrinum TaxID=3053191 RepID=UPI00287053F2|nr:T cell receptor alpha chain MC.7.G5 [Stegostoma tigrinum]